jgi:hypothetical protein
MQNSEAEFHDIERLRQSFCGAGWGQVFTEENEAKCILCRNEAEFLLCRRV